MISAPAARPPSWAQSNSNSRSMVSPRRNKRQRRSSSGSSSSGSNTSTCSPPRQHGVSTFAQPVHSSGVSLVPYSAATRAAHATPESQLEHDTTPRQRRRRSHASSSSSHRAHPAAASRSSKGANGAVGLASGSRGRRKRARTEGARHEGDGSVAKAIARPRAVKAGVTPPVSTPVDVEWRCAVCMELLYQPVCLPYCKNLMW